MGRPAVCCTGVAITTQRRNTIQHNAHRETHRSVPCIGTLRWFLGTNLYRIEHKSFNESRAWKQDFQSGHECGPRPPCLQASGMKNSRIFADPVERLPCAGFGRRHAHWQTRGGQSFVSVAPCSETVSSSTDSSVFSAASASMSSPPSSGSSSIGGRSIGGSSSMCPRPKTCRN